MTVSRGETNACDSGEPDTCCSPFCELHDRPASARATAPAACRHRARRLRQPVAVAVPAWPCGRQVQDQSRRDHHRHGRQDQCRNLQGRTGSKDRLLLRLSHRLERQDVGVGLDRRQHGDRRHQAAVRALWFGLPPVRAGLPPDDADRAAHRLGRAAAGGRAPAAGRGRLQRCGRRLELYMANENNGAA